MNIVKGRWTELGLQVLIVGLICSLSPSSTFLDLFVPVVIVLAWCSALSIARNSGQLGLPSRIVFWSWFAIMCGLMSLAIWSTVGKMFYPRPPLHL